jgi:uroporphyrinogen-III synthase
VSDRRRHPLADLLEALGARVVGAQGARSLPQADEPRVRAATTAVLAEPVDELVISSTGGLRRWLALARGWGVADDLSPGSAVPGCWRATPASPTACASWACR